MIEPRMAGVMHILKGFDMVGKIEQSSPWKARVTSPRVEDREYREEQVVRVISKRRLTIRLLYCIDYNSSGSQLLFLFMRKIRFLFTTLDPKDHKLFQSMSSWWSYPSSNAFLYQLNFKRMEFILSFYPNSLVKPLKGLKFLDVGCGAGMLSESLCRKGAQVLAIDTSENSIKQAQEHRTQYTGRQRYNSFLKERWTASAQYDVNLFTKQLAMRVKPNGYIFISSFNRSLRSFVEYIFLAQYVLGIVPKGTHEYNKLLTQEQITVMMQEYGNCQLKGRKEMGMDWLGKAKNKGESFILCFKKKE